jgi:hypothetical protein
MNAFFAFFCKLCCMLTASCIDSGRFLHNFIPILQVVILKQNHSMKKIAAYSAILLLAALLTSFTPPGNGNIITFDNGANYFWKADNCIAPLVPHTSQRDMKSSKGFFMVDVTFQLPAGHCDIPARGTTTTRYALEPEQWAVIHSDGRVIAKILQRANGK